MMQAGGSDAADVHAGPLANRLESFEDGNIFRGVRGHQLVGTGRSIAEWYQKGG
jgi:hypothetical protein